MKVAIVHDSLVEFGGAERVLLALLEAFPKAHLYTAYTSKIILKNYFSHFDKSLLFSSIIQNTKLQGRNSLFQILSPLIWRRFNFDKYNLVISNSAYMLSNLVCTKRSIHIQYINCPPKNLFCLLPKRPLQKIIPYTNLIGRIYVNALQKNTNIIVNSFYTKNNIKKISGISSKVIYPPVNIPNNLSIRKKGKYFLTVSRIDPEKCIEIAIMACNILKKPLYIVGETNKSSYEEYLKKISGPTIYFLGRKTDTEIASLYQSAIAFLFTPKKEDFGIAPVEAMAYGVPVIAFWGGGVKETVIPNKTGLFFYKHQSDDLIKALNRFFPKNFNSRLIFNHAKKYRKERFIKEVSQYIKSLPKDFLF